MNYNNIMLINQDSKPEVVKENNMYQISSKDMKLVDTDTSDINTDSLPNQISPRQKFETVNYDKKRHKFSLQLSLKSDNSLSSLTIIPHYRLSNSAINLSKKHIKEQQRILKELSDRSGDNRSGNNGSVLSERIHVNMPDLREIVRCLRSDDTEVQFNAAAYLQHLTYQNEDNKEVLRTNDAIPALISLLSSRSSTCQFNAASVLRNLSHGSNIQIKNQIQQCGGVEIMESLVERSHQLERRLTEVVIAVLCNLSCNTAFQIILVNSTLPKVVQCVLLPLLNLKMDRNTARMVPFSFADLSFSYNSLLEYITAFLKNLSSGHQPIRQQLRHCVGLVDSIIAIVRNSDKKGYLNSCIVENCLCIIRNLCYALQEVIDPNYLSKKSANTNLPLKNGKIPNSDIQSGYGSRSSKENLLTPRSTRLNSPHSTPSSSNGVDLLWDDEIIDILLLVSNECSNYATVEAAVGAVQNLAACDWNHAKEFRFNFRKRKGLPSLVVQLNNAPDKVVKVTLTAMRNLSEDDRNLDLIGKHCLYHLIRLLPSPSNPIVKRVVVNNVDPDGEESPEEYLGLDTIHTALSLIYFILKTEALFCRDFVEMNGVRSCIFLLKADSFYKEHLHKCSPRQSDNADKIPILAANILQMLWAIQELGPRFKKEKLNSEDFCVQTMASELKSNISCSQKDSTRAGAVYYGKPYIKARTNALIPWTYILNQRQPTISKSNEHHGHPNAGYQGQNSEMPHFFIETADNDLSQVSNVRPVYPKDAYYQNTNQSGRPMQQLRI